MASESTRDRILTVALEAFSGSGYYGTSMRQLAGSVGIQAASVYAHFASKEAILKTLLATRGPGSGALLLAEAAQRQVEAQAVLADFTDMLIENWTTREARLFRSMLSRMGADMGPKGRYLDGVKTVISELSNLFDGWMRGGTLRDDVPANLLAWEFMAPIGNLRTTFWDQDASETDVEQGIRLAREHLAYFIRCNFRTPARGERAHSKTAAAKSTGDDK
jgi:AcrR family transcriptional regulator